EAEGDSAALDWVAVATVPNCFVHCSISLHPRARSSPQRSAFHWLCDGRNLAPVHDGVAILVKRIAQFPAQLLALHPHDQHHVADLLQFGSDLLDTVHAQLYIVVTLAYGIPLPIYGVSLL